MMNDKVLGLVGVGALCAAVGAVAVAAHGAPARGAGAAVEIPSSSSVLARLDFPAAPVIGVNGFTGAYGDASTGSAGGSDASAFPDPDGVTNYVTFTGPKDSQTSGLLAPLVYEARSDINTVSGGPGSPDGPPTPGEGEAEIQLTRGGPTILTFATLQNYARCAPPPAALATAYIVAPTILGQPITEGVPLVQDVTGAQLGYPKIASGKFTTTLTLVRETVGSESAAARTVFLQGRLRHHDR